MNPMGSVGAKTEFGHAMKAHFLFDSKFTNLNHGSFGTYPIPVRNAIRGYHKLNESAPDKFLRYQYIDLLDKSRERVAKVLNAPVDECVFVQNATTGLNTVLRNLHFKDKDCILYFDTIYGAIEKTLVSLQETHPQLHLRKVGHGQDFAYSLPCTHAEILNAFSQTISRVLYDGYTPRVAVFDTIVSLPGVRFPFERLTRMCKEYNILSLIDGAHAIGQIPLNLTQLDADFFTSNCHKWMFTPRGCAVLHVPKRNHHLIRTTFPTSHGFEPLPDSSTSIRNPLPPTSKPRFVNLFQFVATADNTPYYCVPAALNFRQNLCGGEEAIYTYIRDIAQRGADLMATVMGTEVMDDMDAGQGLKTMGSYEANDRRDGGWSGGLRDCAMANVLLPITIVGASSQRSLSLGPGGAGSAGGLSPAYGSGRKGSYGLSSGLFSIGGSLSAPSYPWTEQKTITSSPTSSPGPSPIGGSVAGPVMLQQADVSSHIAWMERTLVDEFNTFVPIFEYNGRLWTRISGQIYLELKDFEWLGGILNKLCERIGKGDVLKSPKLESLPRLNTVSEIDLEALGRSVSAVSVQSPVAPSTFENKRFDITQGGWVEI